MAPFVGRTPATALAVLVLVHDAAPAMGWTRVGHEQINRIAEGLLKGKRRDQVRTLLHEDLFDAGGWEVAMTGTYPKTESLHYHRQTPEWTCREGLGDAQKHMQCDGKTAEEDSLFCALAYFWDQFSHQQLLEHYPEPKQPINTPKELEVLGKLPKREQTSTNYLRWLVILMGDLHQPLHWLRGTHDYGRQIKVSYHGERHTLLDFWEEYLPRHATPPKAADLDKEFNERAMSWDYMTPPELFRVWAAESGAMACEVYRALEVNHGDGTRGLDSVYELTDEKYKEWAKLWQEQVAKGGERIAFVMQSVLEHRRHHFALKEGRGHRHHRLHWKENLLTNAALGIVVVPGLLFLFHLHSRGGANGRVFSKDSKN